MSNPITPEQRAFVERLLEEWAVREEELPSWDDAGRKDLAECCAEFERLFPKEGA